MQPVSGAQATKAVHLPGLRAADRARRRAPRRLARGRRARRGGRPGGPPPLAHALLEDRLTWRSADRCSTSCAPGGHRTRDARRADARRRTRPAARPGSGRDARDAASAAHRGRIHGLAHPPQGGGASAGPCGPRGAALQHPRHIVAARHERRTRSTAGVARGVRSRGGDGFRARPRTPASLAGRLVVRHRDRAQVRSRLTTSRARSCCRRRCIAPTPARAGGVGRATRGGSSRSFPSSTTICDRMPRPSDSRRSPDARRDPVEGGKHLWVGETQTARVLTEIVAARQSGRPAAADRVGRPAASTELRSRVSARSGAGSTTCR